MENFIETFNLYARSELLILVPVIYVISKLFAMSKISNERIPILILGISVLLSGIYIFSTVPLTNIAEILLAIFASFTQGVLYAGASLLGEVLFSSNGFIKTLDQSKTPKE